MKSFGLTVIFLLMYGLLMAGKDQDSLVVFSDLKYHSQFEANALQNFVKYRKDTFQLFLAIDEQMTPEEAGQLYLTYQTIYSQLSGRKIESMKINKKIKTVYTNIHDRFLKKYSDKEYFPVMMQSGRYNCVSASMLFAMIFDQVKIPYKVMASSEHVYLAANPGPHSVVIETTNPGFEKAIFNGEFKMQYVNYLRTSKLISEDDYKNKSVEEIFEEKFNEVNEAVFFNMPGFQYYNKALFQLQKNDNTEAYELCQKAYFFYPVQQVKTLLYTALLYRLQNCNFYRVANMDYIAQLSRYENTKKDIVTGLFNNALARQLQYTDREKFCDSLFLRLTSGIFNKELLEELSFNYYMQMSYRYQNTEKVLLYVENALKIRSNFRDANIILVNYIRRKLDRINDPQALLDSTLRFQEKYHYEQIAPVLSEYRLLAILKIAFNYFEQKKIDSGEYYLQQFESLWTPASIGESASYWIEKTYLKYADYYKYRKEKTKAKNIINRGLKYAPDGVYLKSASY